MSSANKTVIAFDLYGTLLSTESIAKELATHFSNEKASTIAALWRRYQLEYTWRMNSMGNLSILSPKKHQSINPF
jgi:2-haloacid dehalogenase